MEEEAGTAEGGKKQGGLPGACVVKWQVLEVKPEVQWG